MNPVLQMRGWSIKIIFPKVANDVPKKPIQFKLKSAHMTSRARKYYEQTFRPKYEAKLKEVEATPLGILVWGPGPTGGALYGKRVQIKNVLRQQGDAAVFSEEIDADCGNFGASSKARELLQALTADFVVVLYSSPGSIAEVHDFAAFVQSIGSKMLVFIDSRHTQGYGYTGALSELSKLYNNVHSFKYPRDIVKCHLLAKVQDRVRVLRWAKWRANQMLVS